MGLTCCLSSPAWSGLNLPISAAYDTRPAQNKYSFQSVVFADWDDLQKTLNKTRLIYFQSVFKDSLKFHDPLKVCLSVSYYCPVHGTVLFPLLVFALHVCLPACATLDLLLCS